MIFGLPQKKQPLSSSDNNILIQRLKNGLNRTRSVLFTDIGDLLKNRNTEISREMLDALEEHLLMADVGVPTTTAIIDKLGQRARENRPENPADLQALLRDTLREILEPVAQPLVIPDSAKRPHVILVTGVNGVGKTTSIGKIASYLQARDYTVMLAAGDTFRAAAIEQLQSWGKHNNVPVITQHNGADAAAVIYDALQSARARDIDVLIADTAGRLHTQVNLMDELKKIRRVISKFDAETSVECLLVLDAGTGQNALSQVRQFNEAIGITGIMLTKLDGTAKGGVIFALARDVGLPIRFIGVGEQVEDLQVFHCDTFLNALFEPLQ